MHKLQEECADLGVHDTTIRVVKVDLSSLDSIRECASKWEADGGEAIHVLINNAGIFSMGSMTREETPAGFESHLGTNHIGPSLLTLLLLPYLRKAGGLYHHARGGTSGGARVVTVASVMHKLTQINLADINFERRPYSSGTAYAQSKLANILFTSELRRRIPSTWNIHCVSLHPGNIMTDIVRTLPKWLQTAYKIVLPLFNITSAQGARCSVYCASNKQVPQIAKDHEATCHGYFDSACKPDAPWNYDPSVARWLWDWTIKAAQVPDNLSLPDPDL